MCTTNRYIPRLSYYPIEFWLLRNKLPFIYFVECANIDDTYNSPH